MSAALAPDTNAAIVLGIASTALPFAPSREAEAERWLRILRLHGEAGSALQALGVSEAPLEAPHEGAEAPSPPSQNTGEVVARVTDSAVRAAGRRGAESVHTSDVLVGVIDVYGSDFNHVLEIHGTDRDEVLARLGAELPTS